MATISINVPELIQGYVLEAFCNERGYEAWAESQEPQLPVFSLASDAHKVAFLCYYLGSMLEESTMSYERSKAAELAAAEREAFITPYLVGSIVVTVTV